MSDCECDFSNKPSTADDTWHEPWCHLHTSACCSINDDCSDENGMFKFAERLTSFDEIMKVISHHSGSVVDAETHLHPSQRTYDEGYKSSAQQMEEWLAKPDDGPLIKEADPELEKLLDEEEFYFNNQHQKLVDEGKLISCPFCLGESNYKLDVECEECGCSGLISIDKRPMHDMLTMVQYGEELAMSAGGEFLPEERWIATWTVLSTIHMLRRHGWTVDIPSGGV